MKKVTAFAMAAVVAASALTGCGSSSTAETTAAATEAKTEDIPLILIQFSVGYLSRSLWS